MATAQALLERKGFSVATIPRDATVLRAAQLMNERRIGALVVMDQDQVVGMFTERDILTRVVAARRDPAETRVSDVMTSPMVVCRRDTPLDTCRALMTERRVRHLPIVENGELFGLISAGDIMANEVDEQQHTIEYLHEYLHGRT